MDPYPLWLANTFVRAKFLISACSNEVLYTISRNAVIITSQLLCSILESSNSARILISFRINLSLITFYWILHFKISSILVSIYFYFMYWQVEQTSQFKRNDLDVFSTVQVDMVTAMLGGTQTVSGLSGRIDVKIPPKTQPGTNFRCTKKFTSNLKLHIFLQVATKFKIISMW